MQTIFNAATTAGTSAPVTNAPAREHSNVPGLTSILATLPRNASEAEIKAAIGKRINAMRAHAEKHGYNVIRFGSPGEVVDREVNGSEVQV